MPAHEVKGDMVTNLGKSEVLLPTGKLEGVIWVVMFGYSASQQQQKNTEQRTTTEAATTAATPNLKNRALMQELHHDTTGASEIELSYLNATPKVAS